MAGMSELVSVLIPCFNAERWIAEAIQSALAQTHSQVEVVVVDDGSTDGSLDIIRRFDDRIRWETGANRGGNAARNRLLDLARGEWVQYLDADDYLLPDKVDQQIRYLVNHQDTDVLYGLVTREDWSGSRISRVLQLIPEPHDSWILLARWYLPQTGGPLWRKSTLESVGGWKVDQPCCQEQELYLRLLMANKRFTYCPFNGAMYRIWSDATVCHVDKPRTRRERLEILRREEFFLRSCDQLTALRLHAISQSRFEVARLTWSDDPKEATNIVELLLASDPNFRPLGAQPGGHHPPLLYRLLWPLVGFGGAEKVADCARLFRGPFGAPRWAKYW